MKRYTKISIALVLASLLLALSLTVFAAEAGKVFFSAYVEGSSFNKALSLFNGYGVDLDLSNYEIWVYANGAGTPTASFDLTGTLPSGQVLVVAHPSADAGLLAMADITRSLNYNGDDAIALVQLQDQGGATINQPMDVIGQIGVDPGSEWNTGGIGTQDETLYRDGTVSVGDMDGSDAFDPSIEWSNAPQDTFTGIDTFSPNGWVPNAVSFSGFQANASLMGAFAALVLAGGLVVLRKRS